MPAGDCRTAFFPHLRKMYGKLSDGLCFALSKESSRSQNNNNNSLQVVSNFGGLVLGCIEANIYEQILVPILQRFRDLQDWHIFALLRTQ